MDNKTTEEILAECFDEAAETIRQQQDNPAEMARIEAELAQIEAAGSAALERLESGQATAALKLRSDCYKG